MDDLFHIDAAFTDEERLIRDNVARFVQARITPHITDAFEAGEFPKAFMQGVAELGVLGMTLPEAVGGAGASSVAYGLVCQELERGDSGLRSFVSVQSSLCMFPIHRYGSEAQQKQFLPEMAKGKLIGCFGLTEPDSGSDPGAMRTSASKVAGGWRLNGAKLWITNAPIADLAIVWASTSEGVRGFIVERDMPGFSCRAIKRKLSLRASETGELIFEDCFIPDSHYLPGSEQGLSAALNCLTQARYGIAWGTIGAAMDCYNRALSYSLTRKQFDVPIAAFQLIQKDLVDMNCEIQKARLLNLQLGRLKDAGDMNYVMVSMAKMNACRQALEIARSARNILGANGISLEYDVIRHMNNLESVFTYEGTDNVHHLIVGRHITGINAFSHTSP